MATMTEMTLDEQITSKVASLSPEQAIARAFEIADHEGLDDPATLLEFAKCLFGPDAEVGSDEVSAE